MAAKVRYAIGMGGIPVAIPAKPKPKPSSKPAATASNAPGGLLTSPVSGSTPTDRAVAQTHSNATRARRALPAQPVPYVPVIPHPTKPQRRAARQVIGAAQQRAMAGATTGAQRVAAADQFEADLKTDPRLAHLREAVQHYAKIELNNRSNRAAGTAGVSPLAPRSERLATGQQVLANLAARDTVKPGVPKSAAHNALASILAQTSLGSASAENNFLKNVVTHAPEFGLNIGKDAVNFGIGIPVAALATGKALAPLAHGDTKPIQQLAKGFVQGLNEDAWVRLAHGDLEGFGKALYEHPLFSALDLAGVESVVGRTGGAVARGAGKLEAGGIRGRLAEAGDIRRPNLALSMDPNGPVKAQRYSKSLTRKAVQARQDARRPTLLDHNGNPVFQDVNGKMLPLKGTTKTEREGGLLAGAGLLAKRGNFLSSRANASERFQRDIAEREVTAALKKENLRGETTKAIVTRVADGTIRNADTFVADTTKWRDGIVDKLKRQAKGEDVYNHQGELEQAKRNVTLANKVLDKVQKDPALIQKLVATGHEFGRRLNEVEEQGHASGLYTDADRTRRARIIHASVQHLGARHVKDADGESLRLGSTARTPDTAFLERKLREAGRDPATIAYLPNEEPGRAAFHQQYRPLGGRGTIDKGGKTRTGESYRRGAITTSSDILRQHRVHQATAQAKATSIDRLINDHALVKPDGEFLTGKEAEDFNVRLDNDTATGFPVLLTPNGEKMVAMRAHGVKVSPETLASIKDLQNPSAMETLHQNLLNDRIADLNDAHARNVVLVPYKLVKQLEAQLKPAGQIDKFFQLANKPFRTAVLPQPRWLTGNAVEPFGVRLTLRGAGINVAGLGIDMLAAKKYVDLAEKSPDPVFRAKAAELRAQQLASGLFVGGGQKRAIHRDLSDFPKIEAAYGKMVSTLPAVQTAAQMAGYAAHVMLAPLRVFYKINTQIEKGAQYAAFGKELREQIGSFTGSYIQTIKLQHDAVEQAARGLVETPEQERLLAAMHETLGKYDGYGPTMRKLIQGPFPFLPWALSAARFMYWTLPTKHTAVAAVLTQIDQVVKQAWEDEHKDVPPGNLKLAIPNGKGGWIDYARYTPASLSGELSQGEFDDLLGMFAPQFQGPLKALSGTDPFGNQLGLSSGKEANGLQRAGIALNQLAEGLTPYLATARRLREKGGTPYADSTLFAPKVKPGTDKQMSAFNRTFNPFRPTYLGGTGGKPGALGDIDFSTIDLGSKDTEIDWSSIDLGK